MPTPAFHFVQEYFGALVSGEMGIGGSDHSYVAVEDSQVAKQNKVGEAGGGGGGGVSFQVGGRQALFAWWCAAFFWAAWLGSVMS